MAMNHNSSREKSAAILVKRHIKFKRTRKVEILVWQLEENSGKIRVIGNWSHEHVWGHPEREQSEVIPKQLQRSPTFRVQGIYPGMEYNSLKSLRCQILPHVCNGSMK